MSLLNTAVIFVLVATPVALGAGTVVRTVGRVVSDCSPVVNDQTAFVASALPATSATAVVMVAVNCELTGNTLGVVGVKTAVRLAAE